MCYSKLSLRFLINMNTCRLTWIQRSSSWRICGYSSRDAMLDDTEYECIYMFIQHVKNQSDILCGIFTALLYVDYNIDPENASRNG